MVSVSFANTLKEKDLSVNNSEENDCVRKLFIILIIMLETEILRFSKIAVIIHNVMFRINVP